MVDIKTKKGTCSFQERGYWIGMNIEHTEEFWMLKME